MTPAEQLADDDDAALAAAAKAGDLGAFDRLVARHQAMVNGITYRFAPNVADMEDLGQEVFVKAFQNLHAWQPTAPFQNWLRKIAYNAGRDFFRRRKRSWWGYLWNQGQELEAADRATSSPSMAETPLDSNTEAVQRLLSGLPADDRTVLTLQFLEDAPLKDIAETMGWSLDKTKARSSRARKRLRRILEANELTP